MLILGILSIILLVIIVVFTKEDVFGIVFGSLLLFSGIVYFLGVLTPLDNNSYLVVKEVKIKEKNCVITFKNSPNLVMYKDINCNYKPNDTLWIKK